MTTKSVAEGLTRGWYVSSRRHALLVIPAKRSAERESTHKLDRGVCRWIPAVAALAGMTTKSVAECLTRDGYVSSRRHALLVIPAKRSAERESTHKLDRGICRWIPAVAALAGMTAELA